MSDAACICPRLANGDVVDARLDCPVHGPEIDSAAQDRCERPRWLPRREKHTYRVGPESRAMIDARWWTWRGRSFLLRRTVRSV